MPLGAVPGDAGHVAFTGGAPPEDDRTVMVVSYPADKMDRTKAFPRPVGLL